MRGSFDQRLTDRPIARQQTRRADARHAGFAQQCHGARGDQRCLFGRFGCHCVACGERCRDLASEDRQRKVPRRDSGEHASAAQAPRCSARRSALSARAGRQNRVGHAAAYQRQKSAASRTSAMPSASVLPASRASRNSSSSRDASMRSAARSSTEARRCTAGRVPLAPAAGERRERRVDVCRTGIVDRPDQRCAGRRDCGFLACLSSPVSVSGRESPIQQAAGAIVTIGEIKSGGIDVDRDRDRGAGEFAGCDWHRASRSSPHRIGDDCLLRHGRIDQPMHETGVGPVLQQPTHQIGEQVLVCADRCIDAHRAGMSTTA